MLIHLSRVMNTIKLAIIATIAFTFAVSAVTFGNFASAQNDTMTMDHNMTTMDAGNMTSGNTTDAGMMSNMTTGNSTL